MSHQTSTKKEKQPKTSNHAPSQKITKQDMLLYYYRPREPCFMQKGIDNYHFKLPEKFYPKNYRKIVNKISGKYEQNAKRTIEVKDITLPDLSIPKQLPYNGQFSLFIPKHQKMASALIGAFMDMPTVEDLFALAAYCQMTINPYLFNYSLSVAIMHRPDTKGVAVPNLAESFPDKFLDPVVFRRAREMSTVLPAGSRLPIEIPVNFTASHLEPEQAIAYWREDIGLNLHHWHWHLVYPFDAPDRKMVDKDRRGELFYYMHQQIMARYENERMCVGLAKVKRLADLREPIDEGYYSKLNSIIASRTWPPRPPQSYLKDLNRSVEEIKLDISNVELWKSRIIGAIQQGFVYDTKGNKVSLDNDKGIDIVGNIVESSILSINRPYYGDPHNSGHLLICLCHDPDGRYLELFSVMGDTATAMRDPTFYLWHGIIDDIFNLHKCMRPSYTKEKLNFPGLKVESLNIVGVAGTNKLATLWEQSTMELGRGLDFTKQGSILARFTHMQHEDFNYEITVTNSTGKAVAGTVRIFMGPARDENGQPLEIERHRRLMMELDKFSQPISTGTSVIRRRSTQSTVTIPYSKTFANQLDRQGEPGSTTAEGFDFCGCGWPHNLLIPKGTDTGHEVDVFVMISNWDEDKIVQDLEGTCNGAPGYCGVRDRLYPDRQCMGYPFDRPLQSHVKDLNGFLTPNMALRRCTITFTNKTRQRKQQRYPEDDPKEDKSVESSQ